MTPNTIVLGIVFLLDFLYLAAFIFHLSSSKIFEDQASKCDATKLKLPINCYPQDE